VASKVQFSAKVEYALEEHKKAKAIPGNDINVASCIAAAIWDLLDYNDDTMYGGMYFAVSSLT
jgi:hypothetical protein